MTENHGFPNKIGVKISNHEVVNLLNVPFVNHAYDPSHTCGGMQWLPWKQFAILGPPFTTHPKMMSLTCDDLVIFNVKFVNGGWFANRGQ